MHSFNHSFSVCYGPVGLVNAKLHWLSQLGDLGIPIPRVAVVKVGALDVWSKPLLTGRSWEFWGSLLNEMHSAGGRVYGEYVFSALPTHFDVGIFSVTQCVGVAQFVSRFLSKETDPCVAVYSVNLWEEGKSGAPCLATSVSLKHWLSNIVFPLLLPFNDSCHCSTKISLICILLRAKECVYMGRKNSFGLSSVSLKGVWSVQLQRASVPRGAPCLV